jgi:hypothetical protein
MSSGVSVRWYGERGIVNAVVGCIQPASSPVDAVRRLLGAIEWADGGRPAWIEEISDAAVFVERGFADFGNPDIVIVTSGLTGLRCVFIEAKIGPYILSMRSNSTGMREPGFKDSTAASTDSSP